MGLAAFGPPCLDYRMHHPPPFLAWVSASEKQDTVFSCEGRDDRAGILGTLQGDVSIVGQASSWDGIVEVACAQLGRHPSQSVYITNEQRQVLAIRRQARYDADLDWHARGQCMAWAMLVLCLLSFVAAVVTGLGWLGFALFALFSLLYLAAVWRKWFNEVEAGVVCALALFLTVAFVRARLELPPAAPGDLPEVALPVSLPQPN